MNAVTEEQQLWISHRGGKDRGAHQQLFFRYAPWARAVARDVYRRMRIPQMDWNDYAQNATIGLLEAMSRYDENRGIEFMAYAKPRVRGAVFNGLRSYLSEAHRREGQAERINDRLDSFEGSSSDDPLSQLISTVSGMGLGLLLDSSASADFFGAGSDASSMVERHQMDALLANAMSNLPEREKLVLTLHYFQHMPFVDIAALLGVTKGRISQIHKAAIEKSRAHLRGDGLTELESYT
ncbi:MAG: sigma-70 family RNA polymerase sigma factor [Arenimonas sp.]